MALTGRAALLAAASVLVVALAAPSWWGVLVVSLLVAALVCLDAWLAARVRDVRVERSGDTAARLGDTARVTLVVESPRRLRGSVRDAWPPSAGAVTQRHALDLAPGDRARLTTELHPTRRGDRAAAGVTVRSTGPLGLGARQRSRQVPWTVRVLPPFTSRRHLPGKLARLRELDGRSALLLRGQGTEFDSLRAYVPGDDVRSVDWRATARRPEVVVRTWRPERDRRVLLVLDTGRSSAGRVGDAPRLDAAMDAALLLAALAARAGDHVSLLAYDRAVRARVRGAEGPALLPALVGAMAPLEPRLVESDLAGLVSTVLTTEPRRSLVVLLTGLDAAGVEEGLLPQVGRLVHRHTLVVASVRDPRVAELAAGRGDAAAAYAAASAEAALAERRRVADLLGRHGALVVDALPAEVAPALADAYLGVKAAGRL
ncbi:uncharacterized protein (DUF58 family) [Motilibacter peucedani]|uniref:Uncharacterized protein (DUF58 family) n=1 Tax=Motilibacter peucedani TaxID=598650 RepID=A0A420XMQ6_9ACTN|nr:DUF58 domain-containing protein [Motilibacter peucedani]RKS72559.1 uncharacterized protein (DUF58 family) [Motilibacter peucedani]